MRPELAEQLVFNATAQEVQAAFVGLDAVSADELRVAVMTAIALGDRQDLEAAFPDLAGANPNNWDWD